MYQHHMDSLKNMVAIFQGKEGVIALIFDGSVAKGKERPDSDLDGIVIVTDEQFEKQKKKNCLAEVITGHSTYEGGYFDIKYKTKDFLKLTAERGSEPIRACFDQARVLFTSDPEIPGLVEKAGQFPIGERDRKMKVFFSNVMLNQNYFHSCMGNENRYMTLHIVHEVVYSIYRMILQENEKFFECNRRLEETVADCPKKPDRILELAAEYMERMDKESCDRLVKAYMDWTGYPHMTKQSEIMTQYTGAFEDWWTLGGAPFINEW